MPRKAVSRQLRDNIAKQANHRCCYCRSPNAVGVSMVIDHIIPIVAGGDNTPENLALACFRCNGFKAHHITAKDPETKEFVPLFNPVKQEWHQHFEWNQEHTHVLGKTAIGRATIELLRLNDDWWIGARRLWMCLGLHPPL